MKMDKEKEKIKRNFIGKKQKCAEVEGEQAKKKTKKKQKKKEKSR